MLAKTSLLIPCYNSEKFIANFINQISSLTVPFDEVIFYDDKSTDNTLELLNKTGYKIIAGNENKGPGFARNRLAEAATGEFIHFHDIDDLIHANYLSVKTKYTNTYDVIICNVDWLDDKNQSSILKWLYSDQLLDNDPIRYTIANPIGGINGLYKKSTFLEINGFNEKLRCWEDADLHIRLAVNKARFKVVEEVLCFSLRNEDSLSNDQNWCYQCRLNFLENYLLTLPKSYVKDIISEVNKCAVYFFYKKDWDNFNRALKIADGHNYFLPLTNNKYIKILLKTGIKQRWAFEIQRLSIQINNLLKNVAGKNKP